MNENLFEENIFENYLFVYLLIIISIISSIYLINILTCP